VTTRWTATGTHEGTLMGVPATHRPIEVRGISIDRFDAHGRFAEGWGNWDGIALLRQIGALPSASQWSLASSSSRFIEPSWLLPSTAATIGGLVEVTASATVNNLFGTYT
jgi:hypothetical protein